MRKILVTGANGQLGSEIRRLAPKAGVLDFSYTDIDTMDISDPDQLESFLENDDPDILINCAAYTAVDRAEDEPELAYRINEKAVENLVVQAQIRNIQLIHMSTDFVFDGYNNQPYLEDDPANPLSVYGSSKRAGEKIIIENKCGIIIRTSWLYSRFGNNFVKTMLKLGKTSTEVSVINDQIGSPTWAHDLAAAIIEICQTVETSGKLSAFGMLHYSNEGECSWYEFATEIMKVSGLPCRVIAIPSSEFPQKARRPANSVLDTLRIKDNYKLVIPEWKSSLKNCIEEINKNPT